MLHTLHAKLTLEWYIERHSLKLLYLTNWEREQKFDHKIRTSLQPGECFTAFTIQMDTIMITIHLRRCRLNQAYD